MGNKIRHAERSKVSPTASQLLNSENSYYLQDDVVGGMSLLFLAQAMPAMLQDLGVSCFLCFNNRLNHNKLAVFRAFGYEFYQSCHQCKQCMIAT